MLNLVTVDKLHCLQVLDLVEQFLLCLELVILLEVRYSREGAISIYPSGKMPQRMKYDGLWKIDLSDEA